MEGKKKRGFLLLVTFIIVCVASVNVKREKDIVETPEKPPFDCGDIGTSSIEPDKETKYDIHYRVIEYQNILGTTGVNVFLHYVGYKSLSINSTDTHGVGVFKNGSVFIFNKTLTYPDYVRGYNMSLEFKQDIDVSDFDIIGFGNVFQYFYLIGTNKTDDTIIIRRYFVNYTGSSLDSIANKTVFHPSGISVSSIGMLEVYIDNTIMFCGYYFDGSDYIPFIYSSSADLSTITDVIELNSSSEYTYFDNSIIRIQRADSQFIHVLTDGHIYTYKYTTNTFIRNYTLEVPILFTTQVISSSKLDTSEKKFVYTVATIGATISYITYSIFWENDSVPVVRESREVGGFAEAFYFRYDNYLTVIPDFADGIIAFGFDSNLDKWDDFSVSTGVSGVNVFDWYFPVGFASYNDSHLVDIAFANSLGLWVATLSDYDDEYYRIGNSSVDFIISNRIFAEHEKGDKEFKFRVSGYLERNATNVTEIVEIGIMPIYAIPSSTQSNESFFSISETTSFINDDKKGGVKVDTVSNYIGFGNRFIDFYLEFKMEYCPFVVNLSGLLVSDMLVSYIIYEKYTNGTYTQGLFHLQTESKGRFLDYDYSLDTQVVIEDSHLLDEIHIFIDGVEFDPYNVFFLESFGDIFITDKITDDILHNETDVQFSDPLILPIPAKYEFYISFYSSLDKFGFPFNLLRTEVNGTQVTNEYVRILSPNAEIVVRDFSDEIIANETINKDLNGSYISMSIDVAQVIISNQYNYTIDFYLVKNNKSIYYQLPAQTGLYLRLALGEYNYIVKNAETGETLFDETINITAAKTISFGFTTVEIPPYPETGYTFLDTILSIVIFVILVLIGFVMYSLGYFRRITRRVKQRYRK